MSMKFNTSYLFARKTRGEGKCHSGRVWAYKWALLLATALVLSVSVPSTAQVVSLDSILARIDRQNPSLQSYDNRSEALDAYAEGARSWPAPMVGAGRWMAPYARPSTMESSIRGTWMISVEQDIPNPAKLRAQSHYLEAQSSVEAHARNAQFNKLRIEARRAYYRWLVAEKKLGVLKEHEDIIGLMLKLARIRYPYNQGSLGNIYKAEGRLHEVQNAIIATHTDIAQAMYRLKALALIPTRDSIMVDTTTSVVFKAHRLHSDTTGLAEARSDVQQIQATIKSMELNQRLQRYRAKPDFKLRFDHMQGVAGMPSQFTAMVMVSIPIAPWASKGYKATVTGIDYEIQALRNTREAILTETSGSLNSMENEIAQMQKQLDNYDRRILPALKKNYETLMLAYEENREELPIVIDAWEALNAAQMDYLDKVEAYYLTIASYEGELNQ